MKKKNRKRAFAFEESKSRKKKHKEIDWHVCAGETVMIRSNSNSGRDEAINPIMPYIPISTAHVREHSTNRPFSLHDDFH